MEAAVSAQPPQELLARHEAFLLRQPVDRPLIGFWIGGYYPAEQFRSGTSLWRAGQILQPQDVCFERFVPDYERLWRLHRDANDDFFYVGSAYWGIPWLEAILGCPVVAGEATCWAAPGLDRLDALPAPGSLDGNPWWQRLLQCTRELIQLSAGRFPVCPPLLRGPGDAAAALRGAMNLTPEYLRDPSGVERLLAHCTDVRIEVVRRLSAEIPAWNGTHAAGGYPSKLWSQRTVAYSQEDAAALLSPTLFRRFLLPLHRRMCQAAEVNFIHLHSACLWPVDILLEDGCYDVLEINIDHEGAAPPLPDLMPVFQRIQQAGRPLLLWGRIRPEDWRVLRDGLDPVGLSIQPILEQPSDAEAFV
jgi:hypothetical protein